VTSAAEIVGRVRAERLAAKAHAACANQGSST
jgi:hypothetical protein